WGPGASFLQQRMSLPSQPFKLFGLLRDPVGVAIFIVRARVGGGLLDQLPDVVTSDGDARLEFGKRKRAAVAHRVLLGAGSERKWRLRRHCRHSGAGTRGHGRSSWKSSAIALAAM